MTAKESGHLSAALRLTALIGLLVGVFVSPGSPVLAQSQEPTTQVPGASPAILSDQVPQVTIDEIRIEGNLRIEEATVRSYLNFTVGDTIDQGAINSSLRALFESALFTDVQIIRQGRAIVVIVTENPIVNRVSFEGNESIGDELLEAETQLRPREVYTRAKVQSDAQRMLGLYGRNGYFAAAVTPQLIDLEQNRVDVVFEIDEGERTVISRIQFIGNRAFSDSTLRGEITSRQWAWWRLLSSADTYDPDRLALDIRALQEFYAREGYPDVQLVTSSVMLSPQHDEFFLTFTLDEGERYRFGEITLTTNLVLLDPESLRQFVTTVEGDWYNAEEIEQSVLNLTEELESSGRYPFFEIEPQVQQDNQKLAIVLNYSIREAERQFIERIELTGNLRTLDEVIRRELSFAEGDPFSAAKLQRSRRRLSNLGFFGSVEIESVEGSTSDQRIIRIQVSERSTGSLTFGAGYSTVSGGVLNFSLTEHNLLGWGQSVSLEAELSQNDRQYEFGFTEPYLFGRQLGGGLDIFRTEQNRENISGYREENNGFGLRLGYFLLPDLRHRLFYRFTQQTVLASQASSALIREQGGVNLVSLIGQELLYDQRDNRFFPTKGYYIRAGSEIAGVGGDTRFARLRLGVGVYYPLGQGWVLSLVASVGIIQGLGQRVGIGDRFFLGGNTLRGFDIDGVGPRDPTSGSILGGNQTARASVGLSFPLPILPPESGLSWHLFTDFGTLAMVEHSVSVPDSHVLRASSGIGISWSTPVGPLRFDYGIPWRRQLSDRIERFRISIGARF